MCKVAPCLFPRLSCSFSIVAFGLLFGTPGIFLAVPLAATVSVLVKTLRIRQTLGEQTEVPGEENARA